MNDTTLVTGSGGFVGSHLVQALEQKGHLVLRGDRKGTITKPVDYIFDLAAYGNLYHQKNIDDMILTNLIRPVNMMRDADKFDYKAFIVMSTSSVTLPHQTIYSATKAGIEGFAKAWATTYDRPVIAIRPYTVYGPGDNPQHLIPTIFRSCLEDEPMELDPDPVHDYIYVDDLVEGILLMSMKANDIRGQVIPIGTAIQTSNEEIVGIVEMITRKKANIVGKKRLRKYDTKNWVANIADITKFGWKPRTDITKGIHKIYADYQQGSQKKNNRN